MLSGTVEVDEAWVGVKLEGHGQGIGTYKNNKSLVVGILQRSGKVRIKNIKNADRKILHKFIKDHASPATEIVITDEHPAYVGIADHVTRYETVNHKKKGWVKAGDIQTNDIENVWSLLKRSVMGTYHIISKKHLDAYLDELEWRINNGDNKYLFRETLKMLIESKNMEYHDSVAS